MGMGCNAMLRVIFLPAIPAGMVWRETGVCVVIRFMFSLSPQVLMPAEMVLMGIPCRFLRTDDIKYIPTTAADCPNRQTGFHGLAALSLLLHGEDISGSDTGFRYSILCRFPSRKCGYGHFYLLRQRT